MAANGFIYAAAVLEMLENEQNQDERRQNTRQINRQLRDSNNPFEFSETKFKKLFRLRKEEALHLIERLEPHLQQPMRRTGLPNYLKVLVTLQFLGQGSYQSAVGQDFCLAVSQSAVSMAIASVTEAVNMNLLADYVQYPVNAGDIADIQVKFQHKFGFPGCIGAIDCTHVALIAPPAEDERYPALAFRNRKGYHSLNVQIVCDSQLKILSVNARYPGSVHDAAIWMVSALKRHLQGIYNERPNSCGWLIGDSGYPNEPWLLTPVLNAAEGSREERYNAAQRSARHVIERCIGLLKQRFRCLHKHRVLHYAPEAAGKIINTCVVLHNFILLRRGDVEADEIEDPDDDQQDGEGVNIEHGVLDVMMEGRRIRQRLIQNYF